MIVPCITDSVNKHDAILFPDVLKKLVLTSKTFSFSLKNIPLTLDSGFDSIEITGKIKEAGLIPIIKPNFRNTKNKKIIIERTKEFEKYTEIYKLRFCIERSFAWEDKYRKLVIRYERLTATFNGFRYLASAMINYRSVFGGKVQ